MSKHKGKALLRNPTLLNKAAELLGNGLGIVETAKAIQVSDKSLQAALGHLATNNKAFEQNMSSRLAKAASDLLDQYQDDLNTGKVATRDKPIAMAVLLDKRAMLLGESASSRPDHAGPTVSSMLAELKAMAVPTQVNVQVNVAAGTGHDPATMHAGHDERHVGQAGQSSTNSVDNTRKTGGGGS